MVRFLLLAVGAFAPLFFLSRAAYFGPRSRRLANLALACGLGALFLPELASFDPDGDGQRLRLAAGIRAAIAILGLMFVLLAVLSRRDGGLGLMRPVMAVTFCLLHVGLALGLWGIGSYMAPSNPWAYTAPDEAFRVTLPNAKWRATVSPEEGQAFACLLPPMRVIVKAKGDQSKADYLLNQQTLEDRVRGEAAPGEKVTRGEGATTDGREFVMFRTIATEQGRRIFVARSQVMNAAKRTLLELHFEGQQMAKDDAGRARERASLERTAEQLVQSAE